jgi:alkylation response protein AidB-like acyl-CoA dehydrogenase
MNFNLDEVQLSWQEKGRSLGRELPWDAAAADVVMGAARVGLLAPGAELLSIVLAVEAIAHESASSAIALALHTSVMTGLAEDDRFASLVRGETVGAIALSSEEMPEARDGTLTGRATWVAPITDRGVVVVGSRPAASDAGPASDALTAWAAALDQPDVVLEPMRTAALGGVVCGHVRFERAPASQAGPPTPFMARARLLLAAAGLGMGKRALDEALGAAHAYSRTGAGGEQTVQGLLADAATELDAAMLLTWKAACAPALSLAGASMAKLASTEATQRAVARATQVVGGDSFRRGHVIERLAQDVRALELFAGRTEALREAVAEHELPRPQPVRVSNPT